MHNIEKGRSERSKEREKKKRERKARGGNSRYDAGHGKGGALSERGFIEARSSQALAPAAAAAPAAEAELKKSDIRSIFEEFADVFEMLNISLGQITDQKIDVRGQWLTDNINVAFMEFFDSEPQFVKIDSSRSLRQVLEDVKSKFQSMGYLECGEEQGATP